MDFVILWVDGNDENWLKEKAKYQEKSDGDARSVRFRDWNNLQYWFRSVEKYAPWVEKIHFVIQGHIPKWLDVSYEKLNLVKHSDIIEEKYLPLFNSRAIEVNLHKIKGLSEQFVYFNDDMFITDSVTPEYFFIDGQPCDSAIYNTVSPTNDLAIPLIRNLKIINKNFTKMSIRNTKLITYKYGLDNIRNFILQLWPSILGYYEPHQPTSYLKKTFETIWNKEKEILLQTTKSKFKNDTNVNQYLFRYWQLASGDFVPRNHKTMKMYNVATKSDVNSVCSAIKSEKFKMICINDTDNIYDLDDAIHKVRDAFQQKLSQKSKYEIGS